MSANYEYVELPLETDDRGSLVYVEQSEHIPFNIKRVYYIYDVPESRVRGEHAHEDLEQVLIALSGRLDVIVDDGLARERVTLDQPHRGLYLPPMTWREMENFTPGTVCLVLASDYYDPDDYVHDYGQFQSIVE